MPEGLLLVQRVLTLTSFLPQLKRKVNSFLPRQGHQEVHAYDVITSFLDANLI